MITEQQFINAARNGNLEIVKEYLENKGNVHAQEDYALRNASYYGHTETVRLLLEWKADVHAMDDDALRWASYNGYTETVRVLMEHIMKKELKGNQEFWDVIVMYVLVDVKRNRSSEWFQNLLKDITNGKLKIPKDYLQLFQITNLPH